MVFCVSSFLMTSCDLALQENFEFETSAVSNNEPFDDITALEFITQQSSTRDEESGNFDGEKFDYMLAAINKAGMRNVYGSNVKDRTYLLLNNNAFTGSGDIIARVTGLTANAPRQEAEQNESPEELFERVDTPEKLQVLRDILNYSVVDAFVSQRTLTSTDKFFVFQTLVPGSEGLISFRRDFELTIRINDQASPSVTNVAKRSANAENVRSHNYVFNNGIGHVINDHVRFK